MISLFIFLCSDNVYYLCSQVYVLTRFLTIKIVTCSAFLPSYAPGEARTVTTRFLLMEMMLVDDNNSRLFNRSASWVSTRCRLTPGQTTAATSKENLSVRSFCVFLCMYVRLVCSLYGNYFMVDFGLANQRPLHSAHSDVYIGLPF